MYSTISKDLRNYIEQTDDGISCTNEMPKVLEENWNGNHANAFASELIKKCKDILNQLTIPPFIAPTALNAIQFEWEKENGDYLECEIFKHKIEIYILTKKYEKDFTLYNHENLNQIVLNFLTNK